MQTKGERNTIDVGSIEQEIFSCPKGPAKDLLKNNIIK